MELWNEVYEQIEFIEAAFCQFPILILGKFVRGKVKSRKRVEF